MKEKEDVLEVKEEVLENQSQEETQDVRWYVVHTYSGYENKVKVNLERRVESMAMEDKIFRVVVPMEEQIVIKNGKRKVVNRKIYPGYVLVEMVITDDSWYVVRNTPGVTGFVGPGSKPVPLSDEESRNILRMMGIEEPKIELDVEIGEEVRVISGPFSNFTGKIEAIYPDKEKVKVTVSMFGRPTPIELSYTQIEKIL
jgi:transcriptional antiterminator NusG